MISIRNYYILKSVENLRVQLSIENLPVQLSIKNLRVQLSIENLRVQLSIENLLVLIVFSLNTCQGYNIDVNYSFDPSSFVRAWLHDELWCDGRVDVTSKSIKHHYRNCDV